MGHVTPTCPLLQEGPQCGLVALTMATTTKGKTTTSIDKVMEIAKVNGYTNRGEMFSVKDMAALAKQVIPEKKVTREKVEMLKDNFWLVDTLLSGALMLVPYDCSPNNSPTVANGHKAHWALLTGFFLSSSSLLTSCTLLPGLPNFYLLPPGSSSDLLQSNTLPNADILLVARQSKTLPLNIWSKNQLVDSCSNLRQVAEKRQDGTYVIPEGGILSGLCGQFVLIL